MATNNYYRKIVKNLIVIVSAYFPDICVNFASNTDTFLSELRMHLKFPHFTFVHKVLRLNYKRL